MKDIIKNGFQKYIDKVVQKTKEYIKGRPENKMKDIIDRNDLEKLVHIVVHDTSVAEQA